MFADSRKNKGLVQFGLLLLLGIVLAGVFFIAVGPVQGAIMTPPSLAVLDTGEKNWIATFTVDRPTGFYFRAQPTTLKSGTEVRPQIQFVKLFVAPDKTTCSVDLKPQRSSSGLPGVPGFEYWYGSAPRKDVKFTVSVEKTATVGGTFKTGTKVLSGLSLKGEQVFTDPKDGNGTIIARGLGYLEGYYTCGSTSDIGIYKEEGKPVRVVSLTSLERIDGDVQNNCFGFPPNIFGCMRALDEVGKMRAPAGFETSSFDYDINLNTRKFTYQIPQGTSGLATVQLVANNAFFDSVFIAKAPVGVAKPRIVDVTSLGRSDAGSDVGFTAKFSHDGSVGQVLFVESNPPYLTNPSTLQIQVGKDETVSRSFLFRAPALRSEQSICFDLKACIQSSEFVGGVTNCDSRTSCSQVIPTPTPQIGFPTPTPVGAQCGRNGCEVGENSQNCPGDCPAQQSCEDQLGGSFKDKNGACVCKEGQEEKLDAKVGKKICQDKGIDFTAVIGVIVVLVILGVLFMIFKGDPKGGLGFFAKLLLPAIAFFLVSGLLNVNLLGFKPFAGLALPIGVIVGIGVYFLQTVYFGWAFKMIGVR